MEKNNDEEFALKRKTAIDEYVMTMTGDEMLEAIRQDLYVLSSVVEELRDLANEDLKTPESKDRLCQYIYDRLYGLDEMCPLLDYIYRKYGLSSD